MGETENPFIVMIWEFSDVSITPKTNIIYLWRHQDTLKNPRKSQTIETYGGQAIWKIEHFENLGKVGHRQLMKIRLDC